MGRMLLARETWVFPSLCFLPSMPTQPSHPFWCNKYWRWLRPTSGRNGEFCVAVGLDITSQMSEYDSVSRNIWSQERKVARGAADVTSSGRQFQTRGPAAEKCSDAYSGAVSRRLDEVVAAGRGVGFSREWPCTKGQWSLIRCFQEPAANEGW